MSNEVIVATVTSIGVIIFFSALFLIIVFALKYSLTVKENEQLRLQSIKEHTEKIAIQNSTNSLQMLVGFMGASLKGGNCINQPNLLDLGKDTSLTDREKEIAPYWADGKSKGWIAETLFISTNTVRNHVQNIYAKTGCSSRIELYKWLQERV